MAERTITVNGREYAAVVVDDLTLDEAVIAYKYTELGVDEFQEHRNHPGIIQALIHVAIARGEPGEPYKSIRAVVGKIKVAELDAVFANFDAEAEQLPPPSAPPGASGPSSQNGATGDAGAPTSEPAPAGTLPSGTGSPGSDGSSPSDPLTSAA